MTVMRERRRDAGIYAWFLREADQPDAGGISMIGFDLHEVSRVCAEHGSTVRS
jgi:hypothetical protein